MDDIVEKVKAANRIEDVVGDDYPLTPGGRYRSPRGVHDSLVVDTKNSCYYWNSKSEHGDVINWVMRRQGVDFKTAVEMLCRRAGLPEPVWKKEDAATRLAARARDDAYGIMCGVMMRWLWQDEEALAYARSRGWTDETIKGAMIGYSGKREHLRALREEMKGELAMQGAETDSPAVVAVLGYLGNVSAWCQQHNITQREEWKDYIPGLLGRDMLVYPHTLFGRVRYFSGRGVHEKRHYNLLVDLAGERQPYFNQAWTSAVDACVVVEGQADALTLDQWGIPAVALAGTFAGDGLLASLFEKAVYLGLDTDQAGKTGGKKTAQTLGPMTRIISWSADGQYNELPGEDNNHQDKTENTAEDGGLSKEKGAEGGNTPSSGRPVKDANDYLLAMVNGNLSATDQVERVNGLMRNARTYVELLAEWAGEQEGAQRDQAHKKAFEQIIKMGDYEKASYRSKLAKALGLSVRDYDHILKKVEGKGDNGSEDGYGEPVEIISGFIEEHLIELLYDPEKMTTRLAVRYPNGNVAVVDKLSISGTRYIPYIPTPMIMRQIILLPSDVKPLRSTTELIGIVQSYIHRYLEVDINYERLASYYVLFSWLYDCFPVVPYLRALGEYGTGKTRFIETIGRLCYRPILTAGATSTSSIFRTLEEYHGTLILDEADFSRSDEAADIIKILNIGNKKGGNTLKTMDIGNGRLEPVPYAVFGPKVIATRKKFGDEATESRCLTYETSRGRRRTDIPLVEPKEYHSQAREIRNLLLSYRFKFWKPEIDVDYDAADPAIEGRLNQVTLPLKSIIDDPDVIEWIDKFLHDYSQQTLVERSTLPEAKVLEAIFEIRKGQPTLSNDYDLSLKNIASRANEIIDRENLEDDDDKGGKRKLTPKGVGVYIRKKLQMRTERRTDGYHLIYDKDMAENLRHWYGLD